LFVVLFLTLATRMRKSGEMKNLVGTLNTVYSTLLAMTNGYLHMYMEEWLPVGHGWLCGQ